MRYIFQSFVLIDNDPERVSNLATIIQHSLSLQRIDKRRAERLRIKHRVPFHPIADGRKHAAVSINIHERHIESPRSIALTRISLRAARDDALVVVAPRTILHAEGFEEVILDEGWKFLFRHAL